MVTIPRGVGLVAVIAAAIAAGAVATVAVAGIHPLPDASPAPAQAQPAAGSPPSLEHGPAIVGPPDSVPAVAPIDPGWCTAGQLSIVIVGGDAATGHREGVLRATNVGSTSCVLDGYPDVAIADTDGREVPLEIVHGSSFMAVDPGPVALTLPPGASSGALLGWDASDGRTSIGSVYVAGYPGLPRVALVANWDMTAATRLAVTAWGPEQPDPQE